LTAPLLMRPSSIALIKIEIPRVAPPNIPGHRNTHQSRSALDHALP
jgi:hypothetical protein